MKNFIFAFCLFFLFCYFSSCSVKSNEENWTHFRGSTLNGIAVVENPPLNWDSVSGIDWKIPIHGRGWSSPVIYGDQIWLTTATEDGDELYAVCVDFNTGATLYDINVFSPEVPIRKHRINSHASPTPAIEEGFVYVHFGSSGTACINTKSGNIVWSRTDLKCDHVQGPGSSAFIYKDLLILHYEGVDERFIAALNKQNGELVWKTHRQEEPYTKIPRIGTKAYVTPLLVHVNGRDLIISNGSAIINAFNPLTGEEIWSIVRGAESTVSMPFEENGVVYFETGFMHDSVRTRYSEMMAVNPDGRGDISETNVLWTKSIAPMPLTTPVIKNGLIYTVDSNRNMRCIDAVNGEEVWSHRLRDQFNASPIYSGGKIYFCSTRGETIVIEEGRELKILAENQLDDEIWATPAILRNSLIIRTSSFLYKIGDGGSEK